jgi:hypothetical protein
MSYSPNRITRTNILAILEQLCYNYCMVVDDTMVFNLVSETGKRYYTYDKAGETIRVYESGTEYNETTKKLQAGSKDNRITTANTQEYKELRRDATVQRARDMVLREIAAISPDTDLTTFEDAWGALIGRLGSDAFMSDATLQSRVKAADLVGKYTEARPERGKLTLQDGERSVTVDNLPEGELMLLLSRIGASEAADVAQPDTIEGELTEDSG